MRSPIEKTEDQLRDIVAEELSKILGSNIYSEAFNRRGDANEPLTSWYKLASCDIDMNIQLWERLIVAALALQALMGYKGSPPGFKLIDSSSKSSRPAWTHIETMRELIKIDSLFTDRWNMDGWWLIVPTEHKKAVSHIVGEVGAKYIGRLATPTALEALVNEIYSGVHAYLKRW